MYQLDWINGPSPCLEMVNVAPLVPSYETLPVALKSGGEFLVKSKVCSDLPNAGSAGQAILG